MNQLASNSQKTIPLATSLIAAGPAVEIGNDFHMLDVNELITRGREGFVAYEVTGDSMVGHIQPHNIVFVDTWTQPRNGDLIAADIDGMTCIKYFQQTERKLFLISANTEYKPREITALNQFRILGVVKAYLGIERR